MSGGPLRPFDTDDAMALAIQWRSDVDASPDATMIAAGLIWLAHNVSEGLRDVAREIPGSLDITVSKGDW